MAEIENLTPPRYIFRTKALTLCLGRQAEAFPRTIKFTAPARFFNLVQLFQNRFAGTFCRRMRFKLRVGIEQRMPVLPRCMRD